VGKEGILKRLILTQKDRNLSVAGASLVEKDNFSDANIAGIASFGNYQEFSCRRNRELYNEWCLFAGRADSVAQVADIGIVQPNGS
jgi:hypothetical protein